MSETIRQKAKGRNPKNKTCVNCKTEFHQIRDLERHLKNRKDIPCNHCNRTFCNTEHFQKHKRSINPETNVPINYDTSINPTSGYESYPEFQDLLDEKKSEIQHNEKTYSNYKQKN